MSQYYTPGVQDLTTIQIMKALRQIRTGDSVTFSSMSRNELAEEAFKQQVTVKNKGTATGTAVRVYPMFVLVRLDSGIYECANFWEITKVNNKPWDVKKGGV